MALTQVEGAHYQHQQLKVYSIVTAAETIPDDADQVNVLTTALTIILPAVARPGKKVTVCGVGVSTTVAANTGQTLSNGAVASGVSRTFTMSEADASSGAFVWIPQALA